MKIAVVGIGYVGLVSAACFSSLGAQVYCVDIDKEKISNLNKGIIPIYEPGLEELVERGVRSERLRFTDSLSSVLPNVEIVFIAVGTPPGEDGSADLSHVLSVAKEIGRGITQYTLIVNKSTVPVGTANKVRQIIYQEMSARGLNVPFDVASNPEFLKEGKAIEDFMKPDRVVVGVDSEKAKELMTRLYKPMLLSNFRVLFMDISSAEMSKYASNAMLATRISFMNEIALLCEAVGADVNQVRKAMGADSRIGSKFLYAGCGYGGSCFPKDVKAIVQTAKVKGLNMSILEKVEEVNNHQKNILFKKISNYYNHNLKGKKIAIWGLAFKPDTDDIREATSLNLIAKLLDNGCVVSVYDPIAMSQVKKLVGERVVFAQDMYEALIDADALIHVTEWQEFRMPSWNAVKKLMKTPVVIDGRNVYSGQELREQGFYYEGIGYK